MKAPAGGPSRHEGATRLWLIRHAEVEAAYQGVFGGRIDMNLSPRGEQQAAALARYLAGQPFQALYASPMKRVQQTLRPFQQQCVLAPCILPALREVDFGDWTGLAWHEVQLKYGVSPFSWLDQLERSTIPHAEDAAKLRERLHPCVQTLLTSHPGQDIAVFCHGGVIRMLLALLLNWPLSRLAPFQIEYASLTRVACLPHQVELQLVNFTPWRDGLA